jgi:hypothetical protein
VQEVEVDFESNFDVLNTCSDAFLGPICKSKDLIGVDRPQTQPLLLFLLSYACRSGLHFPFSDESNDLPSILLHLADKVKDRDRCKELSFGMRPRQAALSMYDPLDWSTFGEFRIRYPSSNNLLQTSPGAVR